MHYLKFIAKMFQFKIIYLAGMLFLWGTTASCGPGCESGNQPDCKGNSASGLPTITMEITYHDIDDEEVEGQIIAELYPQVAPQTVARMQTLMAEGFYDGLFFHRVVADFVVQIGDPDCTVPDASKCDGDGKSTRDNLPSELNANTLHHLGSLGMALGQKKDADGKNVTDTASGNAQFYICLTETGCKHLDGLHTVFGKVIAGMSFIKEIEEKRDKIVNIIVE